MYLVPTRNALGRHTNGNNPRRGSSLIGSAAGERIGTRPAVIRKNGAVTESDTATPSAKQHTSLQMRAGAVFLPSTALTWNTLLTADVASCRFGRRDR